LVHDTTIWEDRREERRDGIARLVAPDRIRLTYDDMPGGTEVQLHAEGFVFLPYRMLVLIPATRSSSRCPQPPSGATGTAALNQLVAAYAAKAGLPEDRRTPHVLRHTFCTLLADCGHGLEVIAELAGHADVRTTKGYVHVSAQRRSAAVHDTFSPTTTQTQLTDPTNLMP